MGYVLEGPDGSGKTTLARYLGERKHRVNHFGPPTKKPLEEYLHWLIDQDPEGHYHRVIDRFHLGESVYGPLLRQTQGLTIPELCAIEWALMVRGYTRVFCIQSLRQLVSNLEERGDDLIKIDQLGHIVELYWRVIGKSFMPGFVYDYRIPNLNSWDSARIRETRSLGYAKHMDGTYPGTGNLVPKVVLVGERINLALLIRSRNVPFACGMAGDWLTRAIWHNGWQADVYVTNAKKASGDEDMVARELRWLRVEACKEIVTYPTVVALGHQASRVLKKHQIAHQEVVHPSYHRRFQFHDGPESYAALLLAACPEFRGGLPQFGESGDDRAGGRGEGQEDSGARGVLVQGGSGVPHDESARVLDSVRADGNASGHLG